MQVTEIVNPETVIVTVEGVNKRISLSSLRQPRVDAKAAMHDFAAAVTLAQAAGAEDGAAADSKNKKPLYDVPYYFDAREFLRFAPRRCQCRAHAAAARS